MTVSSELELSGLDGSNPLAFLAALGALRSLDAAYPDTQLEMRWLPDSGKWTPSIQWHGTEITRSTLCSSLIEYLAAPPQMELLEQIGDNLTIAPNRFRYLASEALDEESRVDADFLAAFGSDGTYQPHSKDRSLIQDTGLRTMSGAGHQHFIKFMRHIIEQTTSAHLEQTLFENWRYQDEGRGLNLRWDPMDDRRYAMRWKNPSSDPNMTMRGANRLAIEAIPWFSTTVGGRKLETTGFKTIPRQGTFFYWPIWDRWLAPAAVGTILRHPAVSEEQVELPEGIVRVFRSQRITVGKFRNFTPAVAVG